MELTLIYAISRFTTTCNRGINRVNMISWQSLLFSLLLAMGFLGIVSLYGYCLQRGLSVGGLVLSWNFNNNYSVTLLLPPLLVTLVAIGLVTIDKPWLLPGLWVSSLLLFMLRGLLLVLTQRLRSVRIKDWIICGFLGVVLSLIVNQLAIYAQDTLKLSPVNVSVLIWSFGLVAFLYVVQQVLPRRFSSDEVHQVFITSLYVRFYKKYSKELLPAFRKDPVLQRVFFAILITEDMNRPIIFRFFERLVFPLGFIGTTGIMQVTSKERLTDEKSIALAQQMILSYYQAAQRKRLSEYMQVQEIAYHYNDGDFYSDLITATYFTLLEFGASKGTIRRT